MSFNILNAVKGYLTPDLISKASAYLGESEGNVSKALSGIIPMVLSGFETRTNTAGSGAHDIHDIVKAAYKNTSGTIAENLLSDSTGFFSKGLSLVQALFGDKLDSLISAISSFAGIKNSSAGSLFSLAGPLVANVLGKHVTDNNMSAGSLSSFLSEQKSNIINMIPAGLAGITSILGLSKVSDTDKSGGYYANEKSDSGKSGVSWLIWVLLAVLAALLFWYFSGKGCNKTEETNTTVVPEDTTTIKPVEKVVSAIKGALDSIGNFIYDIGNETEIKLKDGTVLKVGDNSTEARLFKMLDDASWSIDTVDKTMNWVVLDRVYFETGKSVLTAASQVQVKNIAVILKNFPNGSLKLGGYTDNTGDAAINKKVSDERAKVVAKELVKMGAGAKQVKEAVGYGPEFPVCAANDTPECKAQNRRVDLKVASK